MSATTKDPIIDVHCHCTLQRFQRAVLDGGSDWHGMTTADGELDNLQEPMGRARSRIEDDGRARIDVQLVSPTDVFYQYQQDPRSRRRISREANEEVAGMVRDHPGPVHGPRARSRCRTPQRAVEEMTRGDQGARAGRVHDRRPRQRRSPTTTTCSSRVWEAAEELGAFILDPPVPPHDRHLPDQEVLPAELDREPGRPHARLRGVRLRRA